MSGVPLLVAGLVQLQCANVILDTMYSLLVGGRFVKLKVSVYCSVSVTFNHFSTGVTSTTCNSKSVGLVRYPTTLAPASGSVTVTTQCADNAHIRSGSSPSVRCTSTGSWSGTPVCECDAGYRAVSVSERQICQTQSKRLL